MDLATFTAATNPRVVTCLSSCVVEKEMTLAGVHAEGVRIMGAKSGFIAVRLDNLALPLAQKAKSAMIAVGADAAIEESAWAGSARATPLIAIGTRRHFKDLLKVMSGGSHEEALFADAVALTLDYHARTEFRLNLFAGPATLDGYGPVVMGILAYRPVIMGILNVTPDSFSDSGLYFDEKAAVARGVEMAAQGAGIIDVGGESSRPASIPVDAEEEKRRVLPVIESLARATNCPISIDTCKADVARAALDAGACIVNDVTALAGDRDMASVVADNRCPVILMHMKGTPRTMQKAPFYRELIGEIVGYLRAAVDRAVAAGVDREQIVIDPGLGFGKTLEHNLEILQRLKEFASLGRPILIGPSRKSFIGTLTGAPVERREFGTAAAVALAVSSGAHIIRVHDVAEMKQAAEVAAAVALCHPSTEE